MKAKRIRLTHVGDGIIVDKSEDDKTHVFVFTKSLHITTSLNLSEYTLSLNINEFEFTVDFSLEQLKEINQILRKYNELCLVESRFARAPNWKFEFKKMGYVPCY